MLAKKTKYYVISGIGPGASGVGRLMRNLAPTAEARGFRIICRDDATPLRPLLEQRRVLPFVAGLVSRYWQRLKFFLQTRSISGAQVLFLHPQTAGFDTLFRLVKRNNVFLYVMDNSFFCMRSYNLHPESQTECLQCIHGPEKAHHHCKPFPTNVKRKVEIASLCELRVQARKITFLAQNERQAELLRAAFGDIQIHLVGLDTGELPNNFNISSSNIEPQKTIVFHGATHLAKGIGYFISLAERIPEFVFVVPDKKNNVERCIGRSIAAGNIEYQPCNWESGLAKLVSDATIVLNPSLWSAPIEGALLKSLAFNRNVATVKTTYGYEGEVFSQTGHLRLDTNLDVAASQLRAHVDALKRQNSISHNRSTTLLLSPNGAKHALDVVQPADTSPA